MKIILKKRGGGKTKELLKMLKEDPSLVMLVVNEFEKRRLIEDNPDLVERIKTMREQSCCFVSHDQRFVIDNLDLWLVSMSKYPIVAVTMTKEQRCT